MLIYFLSGACSLIDEVVWVRLLKLSLGNTVYAASIVVSTFMAGLALGALIMSRYCDRITKRLRLYALLETLVTLSALSIPFALKIADGVYVWFYRTYHPTQGPLLLVQVLISAAILLVPTILMGSTLPLLGRFVTALQKEAGHLVGRLYALNTLGAALGCFLAGFVLIRALGVMGTLYAAAGLNVVVAAGGYVLSRLTTSTHTRPVPAVDDNPQPIVRKADRGNFYLLMLAFFISGLICIGYEILWIRSIIHLLGGATYVFSAVLTVYLLGNVIGAGIGSGLVKSLKQPALGFAVTLSILGLSGVFYLPTLVLWSSKLMARVNRQIALTSASIPFSTFLAEPIVQSLCLFLFPSLIMGIGFPLVLQAWTNHLHKVGRSTGTAYGANTVGAVIGGLVTGFVLIPLFGLQRSIIILGLTGLWVAAILGARFSRGQNVLKRFTLTALALVVTVLGARTPPGLFDFVVKSNPALPKELLLLSVREGVTTTISLYRHLENNGLYLYSSGTRVAGDTYFWRSDQKLLGHFGVLLNSHAKKVLSVGFGSGESTACLALHNLQRADCVEIAPEMVEFSLNHFKHINLGDRLNEKINMIYMDAKNYIHLTDVKYDAIVNDSIHPREFAENASLYTKEYLQNAKDHLNPRGLFISWIPSHNVEAESVLNSLIGTMLHVFPHVTIWYITTSPAQYFLVIGSNEQQFVSPAYIEDQMRKPGVRDSLSIIDINNSADVLSCYIGDERDIARYIKNYNLNSDYHPFVEFCTDTSHAGAGKFKDFVMSIRSDSVYEHIDWTGFSQQQKTKWLTNFRRLYDASTYLLLSHGTDSYRKKIIYTTRGLQILPGNPALLDERDRAEKDVFQKASQAIRKNNAPAALRLADDILQIHPRSAWAQIIIAHAAKATGDIQKALNTAQEAVQLAPRNPYTHSTLASVLADAGQFSRAIKEYKESLRLQPNQHHVQQILAQILIMDKNTPFYNPPQAVTHAQKACELTAYRQPQKLETLAAAYAADGRLPQAIATTKQALSLTSWPWRQGNPNTLKKQLAFYQAQSHLP